MKTDENETLLAALKEALSYMTGLTLSPSWQRQGAIDTARLAISQAEGKL